ncbi:muscular LMNA-interacting protein isoform X2 [Varanus komodoensis]|uniref:muscular LMNA-interacting protein isoform X2 n=1 Tax=Varanus komodoensis TaxID=61221 RepID=UPI001CF7D8A4|nr:muscular LMNA-interacting protein isoform X2 [Varanus komodoensis]
MDLEKCKRETSAKDSLWKENLKVPSEAGLLRFTFVPSFGRLPTQFHIADAATFLGVAERTLDKNSQECATNRTDTLAEDKALGKESKVEATSPTNSHCKSFHLEGHKTGRGEMEGNDLFKAEFVFITDSDEDTQAAAGDDHGGAKISETSCVSVGGESRGQLDAPQVPLQTELPAGSASQQKHAQLTSPLSASDHLSHKSPASHLLSPTNLRAECELAPAVHQASSLHEAHRQWQSTDGSTLCQSSAYIQSTTSSRLPPSILKRPAFPLNCPSESALLLSGPQTSKPHEKAESSCSPPLSSKDSRPSSQVLSSADALQSASPQAHSPLPSKRPGSWSVAPVCITTHVLSPSPKPLSSPLHGSSSTLHSINSHCSQRSSSGNLLTSGNKSPLPTRLSLLTAILKSGSSPKRPFSPASCPATFSPNSLGSSMLTIDQKFTTPPTPKKSGSNVLTRSDSPSQNEHCLSVFSNVPNHIALQSKSSPTRRCRSVSPNRQRNGRELSPDKFRPLSPTISSYRKTAVSPLLQPKLTYFSLPPHAPRKGALSPVHRTRGPEKSKMVHTYSPTFTAKSYPVSAPGVDQKGTTVTPTAEKGPPSPTFRLSNDQFTGHLAQVSAKDPYTYPSAPSPRWSLSHPISNSAAPSGCAKPPSPQDSSSSVHSSFRACPPSSRPRTPTVSQHRSPTMVHSPCPWLSRSRELHSPLFFSLPSDSENKTSKIKTSYKAFAAIPTNTLLQEQKALDEPIKAEEEAENRVLDTHSEICSPALLRQQTEELCAAIDQVLQNPLSVNQSDSSPSSVQNILDSNIGKANLYVSGSAVPEGPKTKPGVIRPTIVKAKIMVQEEEPVQPNPFKKYLEETNDPETEQDSSVFQPFFHTKLNPSTKSPLYPQQASSHADPLTPGPLNHLGSILRDNHDNSYSLYYRNTLYNKPNHPIVPIPENEALSSEELSSLVYHEEQDLSKGDFPDNGRLHNKDQCRLRRELGNSSAKPS